MDQARASLRKTMKRLNRAYADSKSNHMLYLVLFAVALFFAVFFWNKASPGRGMGPWAVDQGAVCPAVMSFCGLPGVEASMPALRARHQLGCSCGGWSHWPGWRATSNAVLVIFLERAAAPTPWQPLAHMQVHRLLKWIF